MESIGDRLKEERIRLDMNQKDFAKLAKIGITAQVNYEKGVRSPSSNYLHELSKHGIDIGYIVTGTRSITINDLAELQQCIIDIENWLEANNKTLQKNQLLSAATQLFRAKRDQLPTDKAIDLILTAATGT